MDAEVERYRCTSYDNASHTFTDGIIDALFKDVIERKRIMG
jgi:hypothetical protein